MYQSDVTKSMVNSVGIEFEATLASGVIGDEALNLWEMDSMFKCPVIGACLTLAEQKKLLKKSTVTWKGKGAFELHEIFVTFADKENKLTRRVSRLLHRKFLHRAEDFLGLPENDYFEAWKRCFERGELDLAVYAAAVRKDLSPRIKRELFGIIHMNMHETAATHAKLRNELVRAYETTRAAEKKHDELSKVNRELKKEIKKLEDARNKEQMALARSARECDKLLIELERLKQAGSVVGNENNSSGYESEPSDRSGEIQYLQVEINSLNKKNTKLNKMLEQARQDNEVIRGHIQALLWQAAEAERCDATCPSYDLCQKRILIVGGMSKMASHYRDMVESKGGRLEYHDGSLKNGARTLESRFKRADLVLCPVDCNSHAACNLVKRLGKKHKKPVRMLLGSSLNAISRALILDTVDPQ